MKTENDIKDLLEKIKLTSFENNENGLGVITIKDAKDMLIKNLEWILEE